MTNDRVQKAAQAAADLNRMINELGQRREVLLNGPDMLTADMNEVVAELADIESKLKILPSLSRMHRDRHREFLAGLRSTF